MKKLLIATFNPGKFKEYKLILRELPLKLVSLKELEIKEKFAETKKTLEENAKQKAIFYSKITGLPTLADDSGLEIDVLKGEPGVKSKRWPGYEAKEKELIDFTLKKLEGLPWKKRKAQLRAILALAIPYRGQSSVFISEGKIRGIITKKPKGRLIKGYPFRPIFYLPKFKKTFAQLGFKKEIKIGHRKKAVKKLIPVLKIIPKINLVEQTRLVPTKSKQFCRRQSRLSYGIKFDFDLAKLTPFERKVLKEVGKIPYGKTKSYQEIARAISKPKAVRAVGRAISKNPFPLIIPCHRVVGKRNIGGYIFGKKIKKYLLNLENEKPLTFS